MHRKGDAGRATPQRSLPSGPGSAGASPCQKSLMIRVLLGRKSVFGRIRQDRRIPGSLSSASSGGPARARRSRGGIDPAHRHIIDSQQLTHERPGTNPAQKRTCALFALSMSKWQGWQKCGLYRIHPSLSLRIAQNVAGVAARVFDEILLMIFLRRIKGRGRRNLCRNRPLELA